MLISTIILFIVPSDNTLLKLIYAYVTFILWDIVYTVSDIPYWGLSVAITTDPKERLSLVTWARILCNVGLAVSIVIPPLMISGFGSGGDAYLYTGIVMAVIGSALFTLVGFFTKERVHTEPSHEKPQLRQLLKNKPLIVLQSSRFLGAFRMVIATAGLYFAKYNLGDEAAFSLLGGILIVAMILAMFVTPFFKRFFSKKVLYNASLILGFFAHLGLFFLGSGNSLILYLSLFISGLSLGMNDVIAYTLVGDSVDYLESKIGIRMEGLIFSSHTFTTKLQSAFGLFWIGVVLDQTGFIENAVQSASAETGIFSLISIFPAIACVLSLIPMFWYDFTEKQHQEILTNLHPEAKDA
jgi:sugar (glycoside-pentoside-hexuronide) transporter